MNRLIVVTLLALCAADPLRTQTDLPEKTMRQIAELLAEKENRTPAQRKLGSQLIYGARMARGQRITASIARMPLATASLRTRRQLVEVDIEGDITESLLQAVRSMGGQIVAAVPEYHALRAWVPLLQCERLAERDDVGTILPAIAAVTSAQKQRVANKAKAPKRAGRKPPVLASPPPPTPVDMGGVVGHGADVVHAQGIGGSGIKVAAMSDGVDSMNALVGAGHLPSDIVVATGQAGTGDEGTALLNVIHDMAPGAQLFYATGWSSPASMASNIRKLVDTYHVNIIVDDVQWTSDGFFQDTDIAKAVTYAAEHGVLYVSAAGNDNNLDSDTSGTWVGDFSDAGSIALGHKSYRVHKWNSGGTRGNLLYQQPGNNGVGNWILLQWADPWNCTTNDYDLFIVDPGDMSVAASSDMPQYCSPYSHPMEYFGGGAAGYQAYAVKVDGADSLAMQLNTGRGMLHWSTNGAVWGHGASKDAVTVGATNVYYTNHTVGGGAPFTGGSHNPIDPISSDGPRLMFFNPDGSSMKGGSKTVANATILPKIDIVGADAVHTAVPDYDPFGGTSAAAPHIAAIAALIKSANQYITNANVVALMKATALRVTANIEQPNGVSTATQGAGIARVDRAIAAMRPNVTIASNPSGVSVTIAGTECNPGTYTTPVTVAMLIDAPCTVTANDPIAPDAGAIRKVFEAWADGPATASRSIAVPVGGATFTANYRTQYRLTSVASPSAGGSITVNPTGDGGYYNPGVAVQLTAVPATDFTLTGWSGDASGVTNPVNVTMDNPKHATAAFANASLSSVSINMGSQSENPNHALDVPIQLAGTGPVYPGNFQFDLSFDTQLLAFTSAQAGAALTNAGKGLTTQTLGNGNVHFQTTGAPQATIGNGLIGSARLTLKPNFLSGSTAIVLNSCSSTDIQSTSLSTACSAALIVSGWCDLNGDHVSDAADTAASASQALQLSGRDLTRDGVLNVLDAQKSVNAALGKGCAY